MHTLPDFLSWSVLSCLSFSSTLQILAMAHVGSQVDVSCVRFPCLPTTEEDYRLPRWAHRPSQLPGSTHRGSYRGDTGVWLAAVLLSAQTPVRLHWWWSAVSSHSSVEKAYHVLSLLIVRPSYPPHLYLPTFPHSYAAACQHWPRSEGLCLLCKYRLMFISPPCTPGPPSPVSPALDSCTSPPCVNGPYFTDTRDIPHMRIVPLFVLNSLQG